MLLARLPVVKTYQKHCNGGDGGVRASEQVAFNAAVQFNLCHVKDPTSREPEWYLLQPESPRVELRFQPGPTLGRHNVLRWKII